MDNSAVGLDWAVLLQGEVARFSSARGVEQCWKCHRVTHSRYKKGTDVWCLFVLITSNVSPRELLRTLFFLSFFQLFYFGFAMCELIA